ncbi:MAG: 2-keto-4-pentenoate hydratase [Alphaproteobacteria bacterium]|nr:2-keto-4-pentenoate hydratase [Alphaproteobacteria bacterium]
MTARAVPHAAVLSEDGRAIARAFVEARRSGQALPTYPGPVPDTLAAAYAIQDAAIALMPDAIAGWKLGRIPPPLDGQFGAGRLAGPIFAATVRSAGTLTEFPLIVDGFGAVEAEYLLLMAETPPLRSRWTVAEATRLVSQIRVGVEIAGSPFPGINDYGPAVTASDFGNNAGLILGAKVERDWAGDPGALDDLTCAMRIDGETVGTGGATHIPGGPFDSLAFLLNVLAERGLRPQAGQWISTGAATGVHRIAIGQTAEADFGPHGTITCRAIRAEGGTP